LKDGLIEAQALQQLECFEAGVAFAKAEGIIPAPEATHAIAQVIREANMAKLEGKPRTILFNMCGHGFVDMQAYSDYFEGKLNNHEFTEEELFGNLPEIDALQPTA
jgi:tryptophan synthase beta chain